MDRLSQLQDETASSKDSSMDSPGNASFLTANESPSKYYSLSEVESSFDITPINDVTLASTAEGVAEKTLTETPTLMSDLSVGNKNDLLSYKIGKQIEAANILSGGVNIFDNDNSYDGHELVIDDDVNIEGKSNSESLLINPELPFEKAEENDASIIGEADIAVKDTEVVLQIDGNNVNAIDIGNGLYLYRKDGEEELAAVQILDDDQSQPSFKFLKVRENTEGNLEVYEEIEIEVPKEVPDKQEPSNENITTHVPIKNINKVICESTTNKTYERKNKTPQKESKPNLDTETYQDVISETKAEVSFNVKMKLSEARKSPVIGSFTPMTQSTPNKEGIPLTKVMVDQQLHPNRHSDNVKKTIEVHTDSCKQRLLETPTKINKEPSEEGKVSQLSISENIKDKIMVLEVDEKIKVSNPNSELSEENTANKNEVPKELEAKYGIEIINVVDEQEKANSQVHKKEIIELDSSKNISCSTRPKDNLSEFSENSKDVKELTIATEEACMSHKKCETFKNIENENENESLSKSSFIEKNIIKSDMAINKIEVHNENKSLELKETVTDTKKLEVNTNSMLLQDKKGNQLVNENINLSDNTISDPISENLSGKTTTNENEALSKVTKIDDKGSKVNIGEDLQSSGSKALTENNITKADSHTIIDGSNPKQDNVDEIKNVNLNVDNENVEGKMVQNDNIQKVVEKCKEDISPKNLIKDNCREINCEKDIIQTKAEDPKVADKTTTKSDNNVKELLHCEDSAKDLCVNKKIAKVEPGNNNNNAAVPFGKWTEANRQEFLNKFKVKTSTNSANTNQIKQTNDLNRRDVLKNYDIQRQTNSAIAKSNELINLQKHNVKNESTVFVSKNITVKEIKLATKTEPSAPKSKTVSHKSNANDDLLIRPHVKTTNFNVKNETTQRKEINNQDLIDKTIEHNLLGLINKPVNVSSKHTDEGVKQKQQQEDHNYADTYQTKVFRDDLERRMNELHGIPFVERPPHELPQVPAKDDKNHMKHENEKGTKIPKLLPLKNKPASSIEIDSEDEVIEHEPITGDIDMKTKSKSCYIKEQPLLHGINIDPNKETIITEKDFDKFARRNSVNCENRLTVKLDIKKPLNDVRSVVEKDVSNKKNSTTIVNTQYQKSLAQNKYSKNTNVSPNDDAHNRTQSKLQMAYQSVLTAKRQMESPITVIEDKPVKVLYVESSLDFVPLQLNVQGKELSPCKKSNESETAVACDSMDSDMLDAIYECKPQEETKTKTKHQRKQVLTPVDTPEIELIEPKDLGLELSPKKRRKIEDNKDKVKEERSTKNLIPKKSYLLGRKSQIEDKVTIPPPENRNPIKEVDTIISLNDTKETDSAIDKLVKAAELIETQSENNKSVSPEETLIKRGRGRPRKYPLPDGVPQNIKIPATSPKKPRLIDAKPKKKYISSSENESDSDGEIIKENWTMGKINENIVCPICDKLFRSENVVFKHVKHCTGPSPNRSDKDKRIYRSLRSSHDSDTKLSEFKSDITDLEMEQPLKKVSKHTPKKRKSRHSNSSDLKYDDIIFIEDTPVKDTIQDKKKLDDTLSKISHIKHQLKTNTLMCEICGKTFRQLSYLTIHKLKHKSEEPKKSDVVAVIEKSIFSCEICKKDFRKLHHLVQHRLIHKPPNVTSSRVSRQSTDEKDNKITKNIETSKHSEDLTAGFRCERCDKSFRKLHHLVEHRETHDGLDKQKAITTPTNSEKPILPPQCDVCKKTFRKLHHLIEHKEQHLETSSEKSDDKSVKSSLSTKDIIHECPRCYMVFPNEHSLNKHSIICEKKKRQSAAKLAKQAEGEAKSEIEVTSEKLEDELIETEEKVVEVMESPVATEIVKVSEEIPLALVVEKADTVTTEKLNKEVTPLNEEPEVTVEPQAPLPNRISIDIVTHDSQTQTSIDMSEKITNTDFDTIIIETPKKKIPIKERVAPTVTKRQKTVNSTLPVNNQQKSMLESSDDDEVRYMLNPNFKTEGTLESKLFMKIKSRKRNSLQIERPSIKELVKRRTSLQHPPKIPRLKPKPLEYKNPIISNPTMQKAKPSKVEKVSIDSDDSDVKYSFPKVAPERVFKPKGENKITTKKTPGRKPLVDKRRSLGGIAKRKSMGKTNVVPPIIKRRTVQAEHRCDCGQLFSSAALLSRHTSLAHTPPRVRRRRSAEPGPAPTAEPAPRKSTLLDKTTSIATIKKSSGKPEGGNVKPRVTSRKTSVADKTAMNASRRKSSGRLDGNTKQSVVSRKSTKNEEASKRKSFKPAIKPKEVASGVKRKRSEAHSGVPVPEKMKYIDKILL